jgi:low affinity Fe/Cu permease
LDELILAVEGARNKLVHLEELTDEELEQLHIQFKRVQALAKEKEGTDGTS